MAAKRIGILRATRMVARVGKHDATRPVAELQSASDRHIDGARQTMKPLTRLFSGRAPPCCRGRPVPAYLVRAASSDRCARPAAVLDPFTIGAARAV